MRELVHRFKYNGHSYLRSLLAELLVKAVNDDRIQAIPIDALVPVPLHPTRRRERGFNQAEALARALSRNVKIPVWNILVRRVYTSTQTRFDRIDRMENLRNAFSLSENRSMRGKHLVLVDDVLTTGATLHNCAKTLLANGAESVRAITLARG
jgi:ComF family protein